MIDDTFDDDLESINMNVPWFNRKFVDIDYSTNDKGYVLIKDIQIFPSYFVFSRCQIYEHILHHNKEFHIEFENRKGDGHKILKIVRSTIPNERYFRISQLETLAQIELEQMLSKQKFDSFKKLLKETIDSMRETCKYEYDNNYVGKPNLINFGKFDFVYAEEIKIWGRKNEFEFDKLDINSKFRRDDKHPITIITCIKPGDKYYEFKKYFEKDFFEKYDYTINISCSSLRFLSKMVKVGSFEYSSKSHEVIEKLYRKNKWHPHFTISDKSGNLPHLVGKYDKFPSLDVAKCCQGELKNINNLIDEIVCFMNGKDMFDKQPEQKMSF